jgi:hypothetical protein
MCKCFSHFDYSDTRNTRIEAVTFLHVHKSVRYGNHTPLMLT